MKAKHFIPIVGLWLTKDDDFVGLNSYVSVIYGLYHTICSFTALIASLLFLTEIIF